MILQGYGRNQSIITQGYTVYQFLTDLFDLFGSVTFDDTIAILSTFNYDKKLSKDIFIGFVSDRGLDAKALYEEDLGGILSMDDYSAEVSQDTLDSETTGEDLTITVTTDDYSGEVSWLTM